MPLTNDTLDKYRVGNVFFETGTGKGEGIKQALQAGFRKIISIEIDPKAVKEARILFKNEIEKNQVLIIYGDTKLIMESVLKVLNEPVTFWLDAHWDGGSAKGTVCPLYDELIYIKRYPIKNNLILIDDMRIIKRNRHWAKSIQREKIIQMLKEINPDYQIQYTDGNKTQNDIMVAYL